MEINSTIKWGIGITIFFISIITMVLFFLLTEDYYSYEIKKLRNDMDRFNLQIEEKQYNYNSLETNFEILKDKSKREEDRMEEFISANENLVKRYREYSSAISEIDNLLNEIVTKTTEKNDLESEISSLEDEEIFLNNKIDNIKKMDKKMGDITKKVLKEYEEVIDGHLSSIKDNFTTSNLKINLHLANISNLVESINNQSISQIKSNVNNLTETLQDLNKESTSLNDNLFTYKKKLGNNIEDINEKIKQNDESRKEEIKKLLDAMDSMDEKLDTLLKANNVKE